VNAEEVGAFIVRAAFDFPAHTGLRDCFKTVATAA
jgi:hypothetical protein